MGSGNMFDRIAFAYDAANKWMSFGLDQHWRTTMVKDCLQLRPDDRVLDLATGTADVSILVGQELRQWPRLVELFCGVCWRLGASVRDAVLGVDPSNEMLRRGVAKAVHVELRGVENGPAERPGTRGDLRTVQVIDAEGTLAEKSPGAREASVDKISAVARYAARCSMSFGIRNVPDRAKALREMRRVLDPSQQSRVCILELSLPTGDPPAETNAEPCGRGGCEAKRE
ncbi:4-benzoquinol methylase) (Demethylmenaquinone methyltransferase) [Durusdinium trenchii]|uniref:4-benzoquinol methylase (Demethylmenaquinone methyltransferase n=1 Tax=Durusdinium trenchii TaxID=1381693 RepID=A0ABP0RED3_9DINO